MSFFQKIKNGLAQTRQNLISGVEQALKKFGVVDEAVYDELEEALIMADLGVETAMSVVEALRRRVKAEKATTEEAVKALLVDEIAKILTADTSAFTLSGPAVILIVGVNGVGKTTTIGKLTQLYKSEGKSVVVAAADTFRAAAIDQLAVWCKRAGVTMIRHEENSDPAAVVFDAVQAAKARKADVLICDTAGRLHNKKHLMDELNKIFRIVSTQYPDAHREVFLVLDATTGQNALQQAKMFKETAGITGIVLTKLDGTAKGGIVVAIKHAMDIPVRYIGVGEGIDDLQVFDPAMFADALLGRD